ncbi:MAG: chemotaxis-specific protein-glutamate methyltransferase CheB [Deltaproteobacteria bacterium]|nr:chemotaxis-specific protein-glutamate methyltransferase CheB [Deltaproteobacteria bacterium]
MINVLIVDDSEVARMSLQHILESDPEIRVIGIAENGAEAVKFVERQRPDVITMDVNMPKMNGHEATRRIMETTPVPIVVVSASYDKNDVKHSFMAVEAGAVAIIEKPYGLEHPEHQEAARILINTVKLMSEVKMVRRWIKAERPGPAVTAPEAHAERMVSKKINIVAIGASTGGPLVLQTLLAGLDKNFPAPVAVVQHIAHGFLDGMVTWLNQTTGQKVRVAVDGEHLLHGNVYFAPDDFQMGIEKSGIVRLSKAMPENGIRPSVSYLFRSVAEAYGCEAAAVLLTGMGKDGAEELKLLKDAGAVTIAQDMESSVVYGMPGEAVRIGGASYVLPPEKISKALGNLLGHAGGPRAGNGVNNADS